MSVRFFTLALLLVTFILAPVNPQSALRSYVIKKDLSSGMKAGQFSIFDPTEKQLQYRIESQFSFLQSIELVAYPSKQVIAKLKKQFKLLFYKATIFIFDPSSGQWIDGTIDEKMTGYYTIEWNGRRVKVINSIGDWTLTFRDEADNTVLAKSDKKFISLIWANKYTLDIFSDKLPDAIYFLGLAARDHTVEQSSNQHKRQQRYKYD